jgi:hypothetical protein
MKKLSKKLRELYEKIQDERYVRELEREPLCSSFEWVGYMGLPT